MIKYDRFIHKKNRAAQIFMIGSNIHHLNFVYKRDELMIERMNRDIHDSNESE